MVAGLWGKKIGMTQLFSDGKVVPVTVIDTANWFVTQIKTSECDGYNAVQVGLVKKKYVQQVFSKDWLRTPSKYFSVLKEVRLDELPAELRPGKPAQFSSLFSQGDIVDATGITKGCGFAGVVRRHNFVGGRGGHGCTMGNRTGSLSFMRSQGRVIKGKKMPGHMGSTRQTVKGLTVVNVDGNTHMLVKGSVPGKPGALVFLRKASKS